MSATIATATAWQNVWRKGIEPLLSDESLIVLKKALVEDDSRLLQGATTCPPPLASVQEWPVEAACAIGYCGWADGLDTVGEVEEFFGRICHETDNRMGEAAACRWFLNWYDETPREEMRRELILEVSRALAPRIQQGN